VLGKFGKAVGSAFKAGGKSAAKGVKGLASVRNSARGDGEERGGLLGKLAQRRASGHGKLGFGSKKKLESRNVGKGYI
jgi:hypothetical protein